MLDNIKKLIPKILAWLGWITALILALTEFFGQNPPPVEPKEAVVAIARLVGIC